MTNETQTNERRPLGLIDGYSITRDGRVFNASTEREITALSYSAAKRYARADISHDPRRCERVGVPSEPLVYEDTVELRGGNSFKERHVRWVRIPTKAEQNRHLSFAIGQNGKPAVRRLHSDGRSEWLDLDDEKAEGLQLCSYMAGGSFRAVGNTSKGWYRLVHEGAVVLFHGASIAAKIFQSL